MALPIEFNSSGTSVLKMSAYPKIVSLSYAYGGNRETVRIKHVEKEKIVYREDTEEVNKLQNLLIATAIKAGSDTTCAICLEEVGKNSEEISLGSHACTHLFHKECMEEWKKKNSDPKCLLCKQK